MSSERYVWTVFCDDVRQEVGNKVSFIGIYQDSLLVPKLPTVLPKLCLVVQAVTSIDRPFKSLTIRVLRNEEVLHQFEMDEDKLSIDQSRIESAHKDENDEQLRFRFVSVLAIAPFPIREKAKLRVRVITESEELRGGTLLLDVISKSMPTTSEAVIGRAQSPEINEKTA